MESAIRPHVRASVVVPTYNRAARIGYCLDALRSQDSSVAFEVIVVNDGSTDDTLQIIKKYQGIRVISQANAGPAAARNRGVQEASGEIVLFTDDDCEPVSNWLQEMLRPFDDPEVVGAKGVYRTYQRELIARFVQIEYEDRYRLMARQPHIDFIDTYQQHFGGFDSSKPADMIRRSPLHVAKIPSFRIGCRLAAGK